MSAFRICGRSLDRGPGGADSLLDFLFSRCQRIVPDVQRALLYFGFDYASNATTASVISFWRTGSPSSLISIRSAMVSLRLESAGSGLFVMPFEDVRARRDDFVYPATHAALQPCARACIVSGL